MTRNPEIAAITALRAQVMRTVTGACFLLPNQFDRELNVTERK